MAPPVDFTPSHLGICVSDLARSIEFYCEGLGFAPDGRYEVEQSIAEVDGPASLTLQFLRRGEMRLELLAFAQPPPFGRPSARRNQLGLTHLSFVVEEVGQAAAHLAAHGGRTVDGTRSGTDNPTGTQIVFVSDPDGTRIELVGRPAAPPTA